MSVRNRVGIVVVGYVAAVATAVVAAWLYDVRVSALPYDTSGGMYAGGQMLTSLAAFLVVALVPTALALWFLRANRMFWNAVAVVSLAFAGLGLIAVLAPLGYRTPSQNIGTMLLELLGLAQLLGVPLWIVAFVVFAFLAPHREARRVLIATIGIELVIGVCAIVHWFVPRSLL
jgi:hypothetical protein